MALPPILLSEVIFAVDEARFEDRLGAVRMWFHRKWVTYDPDPPEAGVDPDLPPKAKGVRGGLSRNKAIQVAIGCYLVDYGLHPQAALHIARLFSHLGGAEAAYGSDPVIKRLPGGLYREGQTILGTWRAADGTWHGRVINATWTDNLPMITENLTRGLPAPAKPSRVILVDCKEVLESLKSVIGPF